MIVEKLSTKVVELFHYRSEQKILFSDDEKTRKILDKTHSIFWDDIYPLYWSTITIKLSSLMEKARTAGNDNLSFYQLSKRANEMNLLCTKEIEEALEDIKIHFLPFDQARKKVFAHNDLGTEINKTELEVLKGHKVDTILAGFADILNLVSQELKMETMLYGMERGDGIKRILFLLKLGIQKRDESSIKG